MYVYNIMHACMKIHMYVWMYVCMYKCMYVAMYRFCRYVHGLSEVEDTELA